MGGRECRLAPLGSIGFPPSATVGAGVRRLHGKVGLFFSPTSHWFLAAFPFSRPVRGASSTWRTCSFSRRLSWPSAGSRVSAPAGAGEGARRQRDLDQHVKHRRFRTWVTTT